jgi:hypothetical protein
MDRRHNFGGCAWKAEIPANLRLPPLGNLPADPLRE